MKCWKKTCNLGKNSSSLTPSRKANTPLKLTNEISCICCAVRFFANKDPTTTCNYVDLEISTMSGSGPDCVKTFFLPQKLYAPGDDPHRHDGLSIFLLYRVRSQPGRKLGPR